MYFESDHALVLMRLLLQLNGHQRRPQTRLAIERPYDFDVHNGYEQKLSEEPRSPISSNIDEQWDQIKQAIHLAADFASGPRSSVYQEHWISEGSLGLMEQNRRLPNCKDVNKMHGQLQRQLTISLKNDRGNWWVKVAEEMEEAAASGNSQRLFKLIRDSGGRRTSVSDVVCDRNGELIHGEQQRLSRWAEHSKDQFSWPHANVFRPTFVAANPRVVFVDSPTVLEVDSNILLLKRGKAAGPDDLPPVLFKLGGEALMKPITFFLRHIWN